MNTIIVGLDGTLSRNAWRLGLIESDGWEAYHAAAFSDAPNPVIADIINAMGRDANVVCVTVRPEAWRAKTLEWLVRHRISVSNVIMRPVNDWRSEVDIKRQVLEVIGGQLAIDDNEKVCDMYRAAGVPVLQFSDTNGVAG